MGGHSQESYYDIHRLCGVVLCSDTGEVITSIILMGNKETSCIPFNRNFGEALIWQFIDFHQIKNPSKVYTYVLT